MAEKPQLVIDTRAGQVVCQRCKGTHDLNLPLDLRALRALVSALENAHRSCVKAAE